MKKKLLTIMPVCTVCAILPPVISSCSSGATSLDITKLTLTDSNDWHYASAQKTASVEFRVKGGQYYHTNALKVSIVSESISSTISTFGTVYATASWVNVEDGRFSVTFTATKQGSAEPETGTVSFDYIVSYKDSLYTLNETKYSFTFNVVNQ